MCGSAHSSFAVSFTFHSAVALTVYESGMGGEILGTIELLLLDDVDFAMPSNLEAMIGACFSPGPLSRH
jgi:hypothetical protein